MCMYFNLFWSFFKVGLFTFGGGYAMLPLLQREVVSKGWASDDELLDYYAIGQVTPGIIAINVSTFVGYRIKGIPGALCTMVGVVLPSILIISSLAYGLAYIWENTYVQHAFSGIRLMIAALLMPTILKLIQKSVIDYWTLFILILSFAATFYFSISPLIIVISSAILGILLIKWKKNKS